MNKRMKKKQQLEQKIQGLECELAVVSKENMELLNKIVSISAELNTLSQSVSGMKIFAVKMFYKQIKSLNQSRRN